MNIVIPIVLFLLLALPAHAQVCRGIHGGVIAGTAAGCVESTPGNDYNEIGNIATEPNSDPQTVSMTDKMFCVLYTADCSGDVGTFQIYHNTTSQQSIKGAVYSTTDTDDTAAPTNGTLIASATITNNTSTGWATASTTGADKSVTASDYYWLCTINTSTGWTGVRNTGKYRHSVVATGIYTTPPAALPAAAACVGSADPYSCCTGSGTGCSWTSTADRKQSIFVGVGP